MEQPPQTNAQESEEEFSLKESMNPPERIKMIALAEGAVRKIFSDRNIQYSGLSKNWVSFEHMDLMEGGHFDVASKEIGVNMFGDFRLRTYIHEFLHASTDSKEGPSKRVGKTGLSSLWKKDQPVKYFEALNEALTEILTDEAIAQVPRSEVDPIVASFKESLPKRKKVILIESINGAFKRQMELIEDRFVLEDILNKLIDEGGGEEEIELIAKRLATREVELEYAGKLAEVQIDYLKARFDSYAAEIEGYQDEKMYPLERQLVDVLVSKIAELQGLTKESVLEQFKLAYLQGNIFSLRIIQNTLGGEIFETVAHLSPHSGTSPNESEITEAEEEIEKMLSKKISKEDAGYRVVLERASYLARQRYYDELIAGINSIKGVQ